MFFSGKIRSVVPAALAAVMMSASGGCAAPSEAWAWKYRLLVVFAPAEDSGRMAEQRRRLENVRQDMLERDMAVIEVVGGRARQVLGTDIGINGAELAAYAGKTSDTFEVMLFGKDTGLKLRSGNPVSANELFALIDSMPMRRREMREET